MVTIVINPKRRQRAAKACRASRSTRSSASSASRQPHRRDRRHARSEAGEVDGTRDRAQDALGATDARRQRLVTATTARTSAIPSFSARRRRRCRAAGETATPALMRRGRSSIDGHRRRRWPIRTRRQARHLARRRPARLHWLARRRLRATCPAATGNEHRLLNYLMSGDGRRSRRVASKVTGSGDTRRQVHRPGASSEARDAPRPSWYRGAPQRRRRGGIAVC